MKKKTGLSKNTLLLFLLLFVILLMGVGYAAINSITGEIKGTVIADIQQGVFITNVEHVSNVGADLTTSEIKNYKGTMMQSTVKLSDTNPASEITYKVTVYNNSENSYPFLVVLYDEEFYDNPNITFEISADGYKIGDIINPHETKDIYITFKYKDGVIPNNTALNSYLNFKIAEPNRMVLAEDINSTGTYLGSTITKDKIETIQFSLGNITPEGTVSNFDASEKQDKSIMGYYTDDDKNGLYELTFASDEPIFANTNAQYLFQKLTSLKSISFDNFSTLGVTNMYNMFYYCSGLTSLDVSKFDTSKVTDMNYMFDACIKLTSIDVSSWDTSEVTSMNGTFSHCAELTNLDVSKFDTSQVTGMSNMFASCKKLTSIDVSNFNTSKVTNMSFMFSNCGGLTSLDVSKFDTSQVTNMEDMFYYCRGLASLDVSNFDTSQVTNMRAMFMNCSQLTNLDVSGFDTSQVTSMWNMFSDCSKLKSLDVSKFDTKLVTDMIAMFEDCRELTTIYASKFNSTTNTGWTTSAVTISKSYQMFSGCTKLVGGNGTTYDSSHINKEYARIDITGTPGYFTNILNETTPPTIKVDKTSCDWRNSELNLTITAKDSIANGASSGLATSNSYQYYLSNSGAAISRGSWTNYTSGIEFEIKPEETGTYYLFIKRISDNAGNISISDGTLTTISDETYQRFGPYKFDYTAPQISMIEEDSTDINLSDKLIRSYNAQNNTENGYSSTTTVWTDLSGNNNGAITGATWSGEYLSLDGVDDWVNLGTVDLAKALTLEATISLNTINTSASQSILTNYETGGVGLHVNTSGKPVFQIYSLDSGAYVSVTSTTALTVGEKYHILGIYDGTSMKLYVNGVLKAEKAVTGVIKPPNYDTVMAIGANPNGTKVTNGFANMKVYSAKVYDRTLTVEEVNYITSGLIREFDAINNTGNGHSNSITTWTDLSGNYNGTVTGATWSDEHLSLDGVDDWVNLGQIPLTNTITLEATVELNSIQSGSHYIMSNVNVGGIGIYLTNGVPRMIAYNATTSAYVATSPSISALETGRKYHIVGIFDGTSIKLYVDGELKAEASFSGTYGGPTKYTVMAIGANPYGNTTNVGEFADIKVYSARIYSKVLTQEQIIKNCSESLGCAIIKLSDSHSGLATGAQLQYGWSTSSTVQPSSWTNLSITGYSAGTSNVTTTIIPSEPTGKYYLWVKSTTSVYVQDVVGNKTTMTVVSQKKY